VDLSKWKLGIIVQKNPLSEKLLKYVLIIEMLAQFIYIFAREEYGTENIFI